VLRKSAANGNDWEFVTMRPADAIGDTAPANATLVPNRTGTIDACGVPLSPAAPPSQARNTDPSMKRITPIFKTTLAAGLSLACASAIACGAILDDRADRAWMAQFAAGAWSLPDACNAMLNEIAESVAVRRRRVVSIETVLSASTPTSLALARLAALASRIQSGLVDRGIARANIRMREFRFPARGGADVMVESHVIIRILDR
jgi:hypothetical protein